MADAADHGIAHDLLADGFGRIREGVADVVDGLSAWQLLWRPDGDANPVAWLVWHLSRQQDEQVAHLAGQPSAWRAGGWASRFALPYPESAHGYGQSPAEVGAFDTTDTDLLSGYQDDVHGLTTRYLGDLAGRGDAEWGRVVDRHWDPPVTVAVRLVSVLEDAAKHLGQAEYVRGLVLRRD